ncbi:unnamed protein product, partial [Allacma fusca]
TLEKGPSTNVVIVKRKIRVIRMGCGHM